MDGRIARRGGRPQLRPTPKFGWTKAKQIAFLDHLAATCNVRASARAVGGTAQNAYLLRQRDPVFAARWVAAIEAGYEVLETTLLARAMGTDGDADLPMPDGSRASAIGAFDPELAMRLLGQYASAKRRMSPGPRRTGRTTYKRVTVEEVEAALTAKLDALEKRLGDGAGKRDDGRQGETA